MYPIFKIHAFVSLLCVVCAGAFWSAFWSVFWSAFYSVFRGVFRGVFWGTFWGTFWVHSGCVLGCIIGVFRCIPIIPVCNARVICYFRLCDTLIHIAYPIYNNHSGCIRRQVDNEHVATSIHGGRCHPGDAFWTSSYPYTLSLSYPRSWIFGMVYYHNACLLMTTELSPILIWHP